MKSLQELASDDLRGKQKLTLIVLVACLGIFGLHWKYFYNIATGPHEASTVNFEDPGAVQYVKSEGTFVKVGSSTSRKLGIEVGTYRLHEVGDVRVLVHTEPDFEGKTVSGRVEAVPKDVRESMGDELGAAPYMINAYVSYWLSPNLIMLITMVVFPIAVLVFLRQKLRGKDPMGHPQIAKLKEFGNPMTVVSEIEADMERNGVPENGLPVYLSDRWMVFFGDSLKIYAQDAVVAFGLRSGAVSSINVFLKGQSFVESVFLDNDIAGDVADLPSSAFEPR